MDKQTELERNTEVASTEKEKTVLKKEYNNWKWNYPTPLTEETSLELRKIWLQEKINQLSAELSAINNNTNE